MRAMMTGGAAAVPGRLVGGYGALE